MAGDKIAIVTMAAVLSGTAAFAQLDARTRSEIEKVYRQKCSACHSADGSADTPAGKRSGARDVRSAEWKKWSDEELAKTIREGSANKKMPGYGKQLSDDQIRQLVAYMRGLAK